LPPPPSQTMNSTALLLSASSGSFALLGGRGGPEGGELLGNASGAHRKEQRSRIRRLRRGREAKCRLLDFTQSDPSPYLWGRKRILIVLKNRDSRVP
jgi:hypothetical protein